MQIINLKNEHKKIYFMCLEDWSEEMKEAGNHKEFWYNKMKESGLRVKLALNDSGEVVGMIQYIPIEFSTAEGKDLYFINCIWVHGYKKGVGNWQKKGIGKALLKSAEKDVKEIGSKGIVAWGLALPVFMKASWFKKQGYSRIDKLGIQILLWKKFKENASPPRWIKEKKKPEKTPGKVTITAFLNGWCPAQNIVFERAKRICSELGDKVIFRPINTLNRDTYLEWGISDALFIDDKQVRTGPPPSYKKIKRKILKRVKKIG